MPDKDNNVENPIDDGNKIPEETMSAPSDSHPQPSQVVLKTADDVSTALLQLVNLNNDIVHEPTCVICCNPNRNKIEKKWKTTKKHEEVISYAKNDFQIDLTDEIIDNHIIFHSSKGVSELKKLEYIDKIRRVSSIELTTLSRIDLCFAALTERLSGINSIVPDNVTSQCEIEKIKTAETSRLMNSFDRLLKLQATLLGEMKSSGQLIILPRESFVKIFDETITEAKSTEEKNVIKKILQKLLTLSTSVQ